MTDRRHVMLSSNRFGWETPAWFLDLVRQVGPIGFDPCTTPDNPTGARHFISQTIEELEGDDDERHLYSTGCGLLDTWPALKRGDVAFANPPYGPHLSGDVDAHAEHWRGGELIGMGAGWAKKIASYYASPCLVLVPVRTETVWWRTLWEWCDVACLWSSREHGSRINFVNASTGEIVRGSNLASTVFFRGGGPLQTSATNARADRFCEVFADHGTIIP